MKTWGGVRVSVVFHGVRFDIRSQPHGPKFRGSTTNMSRVLRKENKNRVHLSVSIILTVFSCETEKLAIC